MYYLHFKEDHIDIDNHPNLVIVTLINRPPNQIEWHNRYQMKEKKIYNPHRRVTKGILISRTNIRIWLKVISNPWRNDIINLLHQIKLLFIYNFFGGGRCNLFITCYNKVHLKISKMTILLCSYPFIFSCACQYPQGTHETTILFQYLYS